MPLAVCATPIGNLEDVTLRVLAELAAADVVLCEDTRHTRGLLERHGIKARLLSYHEHNEAQRTAELLPRLEAGERIALVSDAGLPGVSDPGARLVRAALDAGVDVTVLPGPRRSRRRSSLRASWRSSTASSASCRAGRRSSRRCGTSCAAGRGRRSRSSRRSGCPRRCARSRRPMPQREVAVCRELTKRVRGGRARDGRRARGAVRRAAEGRDHARSRAGRGPLPRARRSAALAAVAELVAAGLPRRRAAEIVSGLAGIPRNRLYKRLAVIRFDNGGRPRYSALVCCSF